MGVDIVSDSVSTPTPTLPLQGGGGVLLNFKELCFSFKVCCHVTRIANPQLLGSRRCSKKWFNLTGK